MVTYYLFRVLSILVPLLPIGFAYWLADRLGELAYRFGGAARASVRRNLQHVLGPGAEPSQVEHLARRAFRTQARNYVDLFCVPRLDLAVVDRIVEVEGWEHLQEALAAGKGALGIAGHLGNLEVVALKALAAGCSVTIPVEPLQPPELFRLVCHLRASQGLHIVRADEMALKAIYRALQHNELVALASDRDILGNGIDVPFFGQPASLPPAAALIALRTGAALLPVRAERLEGRRYRAVVLPPFWLRPSGDRRHDIYEGTARVAAILEGFIRTDPGQWVMFADVWKQRPSGQGVQAEGRKAAVDKHARKG